MKALLKKWAVTVGLTIIIGFVVGLFVAAALILPHPAGLLLGVFVLGTVLLVWGEM